MRLIAFRQHSGMACIGALLEDSVIDVGALGYPSTICGCGPSILATRPTDYLDNCRDQHTRSFGTNDGIGTRPCPRCALAEIATVSPEFSRKDQ